MNKFRKYLEAVGTSGTTLTKEKLIKMINSDLKKNNNGYEPDFFTNSELKLTYIQFDNESKIKRNLPLVIKDGGRYGALEGLLPFSDIKLKYKNSKDKKIAFEVNFEETMGDEGYDGSQKVILSRSIVEKIIEAINNKILK